jgi:hypothetical protein
MSPMGQIEDFCVHGLHVDQSAFSTRK